LVKLYYSCRGIFITIEESNVIGECDVNNDIPKTKEPNKESKNPHGSKSSF
jgi:hypothetical protein